MPDSPRSLEPNGCHISIVKRDGWTVVERCSAPSEEGTKQGARVWIEVIEPKLRKAKGSDRDVKTHTAEKWDGETHRR